MDDKKFKIIVYLFVTAVFILLGFYLGRTTIKEKNPEIIVKYIKGEKIHDSILFPVPYEVVRPTDTENIIKQCVKDGIYFDLFPEKTVVEYVEVTKEDTSRILEDWATKRLYNETLFDVDTVGSCIVELSVQYNRLSLIEYTYIPITKEITNNIYNTKIFSPYIGAGILVDNDFCEYINYMPTASIGFFIKEKYGVNFQYGKSFKTKNNFFHFSLLYKF